MNQIYFHPDQPEMQAEVILASRHAQFPDEEPLVTLRARYPRIIHPEAKTHRIMEILGEQFTITQDLSILDDPNLTRNARSSRAVPISTMLEEIKTRPFVPWHWGKNQKGMQASEECDAVINPKPLISNAEFNPSTLPYDTSREEAWLWARDRAVEAAEAFMNAGYHKQLVNRLIEPFAWIDTLITTNRWGNFLWLRDHGDAEPHLQDLAHLIGKALANAEIQELAPGDWHQPYITTEDIEAATTELQKGRIIRSMPNQQEISEWLNKISAARCARISYKPFDGNASYEAELARYNMLVSSDRVHASPVEHQATPDTHRNLSTGEALYYRDIGLEISKWDNPSLHGNFPGWIQNRQLIPNQVHHKLHLDRYL